LNTLIQPPYGFRVTIERSVAGGTVPHIFLSKTAHASIATQQAHYKTGFLRLISREPLTREQFQEASA
jgi:hypothetical protein